jgi:hypothetical protein
MTSAAYKAAGMGRRSAERQGYGLVVFAAILLAVIGCLNLIYGIAAIANSFWSLIIIAIDVVALWGLCAYGSRQNIEAAA